MSCKQNKPTNLILNTNNLQEQSFEIDIKKDTNITTKAGIIVDYKANSIESESNKVSFVIKEALDLVDIIKANLNTQTEKEILSSDGMFYIATKAKSKIIKPLQIKIPTKSYDLKMNLFEGKEIDGNIVWENPKPIVQNDSLPTGKDLFIKNCASCHAINKDLTGPSLACVESRWQFKNNLIAFIKNSGSFLKMGEPQDSINYLNKSNDYDYAKSLYCSWNKQAMTMFEGTLSDIEIEKILEYIRSKSVNCPSYKEHPNSCKSLKNKLQNLNLKREKITKKELQIINEEKQVFEQKVDSQQLALEKLIKPSYYNIEINSFGWYNIDKIIENDPDNIDVDCTIDASKEDIVNSQFYLVIPDLKIFSWINVNAKTNKLHKWDDKPIKLPNYFEAYLFALKTDKEILTYSLEQFKVSSKLNIKLNYKNINQIELNQLLQKTFNADSLKMNFKKVEPITYNEENEVEIKADEKLEMEIKSVEDSLNKYCNCLFSSHPSTMLIGQ